MVAEKQHITLVGMGDHPNAMLEEGRALLQKYCTFSGGKRHYELLKSLLPEQHTWIEIAGKMDALAKRYANTKEDLLIVTSGDPFFFGFGNTLQRLLPNAELKVIPWFSSIQRLYQKMQINANELKAVTLHGRPWKALDTALINGEKCIGILTDRIHTPLAIAQRLLEYGFDEYEMIVGEHLDGSKERITTVRLSEVSTHSFADLNAVILRTTKVKKRPSSFSDHQYRTLEGRPGMITKQALRSITLQALDLTGAASFWDVGACTGAIAIEAKRQCAALDVIAFEIRSICEEIINENMHCTGTPGIDIKMGDFLTQNVNDLTPPDAVFIGGHGGKLKEVIAKIDTCLKTGGKLVMNTVSEASQVQFKEKIQELNYTMDQEIQVQINDFNKITLLGATKA